MISNRIKHKYNENNFHVVQIEGDDDVYFRFGVCNCRLLGLGGIKRFFACTFKQNHYNIIENILYVIFCDDVRSTTGFALDLDSSFYAYFVSASSGHTNTYIIVFQCPLCKTPAHATRSLLYYSSLLNMISYYI